MAEKSRRYVIDTNVILHTYDALTSFPDGEVVVPLDVLEELDRFKKFNDEKGRIARQVSRFIDKLRDQGSLSTGVKLENGGRLSVYTSHTEPEQLGLPFDSKDNHILYVAWKLMKNGEDVCFVSKDINARIKADVCGIPAVDFDRHKVDTEEFYSGWLDLPVDLKQLNDPPETFEDMLADKKAYPNQYVYVHDRQNETRYVVYRRNPADMSLSPLSRTTEEAYGIHARNPQQRMALDLLLDPDVMLITLTGQAGTGKTLLALSAGLRQVINSAGYERLVVARPLVPVGKDLGYLPGSKEDKIAAWMDPIFDNLEYVLSLKTNRSMGYSVDRLLAEEVLQLEALTYIRGRSIPNQFLIVDEAQNLTPLEIKTIVSRAGEDTKVVLTGDPYQIDNPYLDAASNGLIYAADKMKALAIHGHISLVKSERSNLAALAAEYL
ncbi:MAG: PhoH family protein [Planctomycetota bacterium]|nr:PhoH family protein [Planctomycetota bacterium]